MGNTHCCTTCTMHGMRCAARIPCVLPVLQQLSTRYLPVAVARSATLSRVNLANYRFENFVMSCCKSIVYMVIHSGSFINVKFFYYVYKTTSINHFTTSTIPIKASIEWRVPWTRCANLQFLFWYVHDMKCYLNMTRNGRNT